MPRRPRAQGRRAAARSGAPAAAARARTSRSTGSVTLEDVARIAGVSAITVSRVVNRPELVRPETVAHVQRAIARTGYVPNLLAGGLASRRSRLVAAVVPTVAHSMFVEAVEALTDRLWDAGYHVVLALTGYSTREEALVTELLGRRPDALFLVGVNHTPETRRRILSAQIPVVEVWDLSETPLDMVVGFSHEKVGAAVAEHLVAKGYRRFASVWATDARASRRRRGFLDALARHGLEEVGASLTPAPSTQTAGRRGMAEILARGGRPDAVVCSSDTFAHGVLAEARARGLEVPRDVAVMGFGDLEFAADTVPALSTVRVDRAGIGRIAAESLLASLEGEPPARKVVDVGFAIVDRETT
jgi:LacI family gluconate utilization system Gnt-I transcriptional repressor